MDRLVQVFLPLVVAVLMLLRMDADAQGVGLLDLFLIPEESSSIGQCGIQLEPLALCAEYMGTTWRSWFFRRDS
uniref:Secreted protein n=1 Tax=Timema poppense TaxID=170557 RepID=A0A7R9DHX6_TIMPO|nr:unnamed protein product [Timema poppensis]